MWSSSRAELVKIARRPASWLLLAITLTLGLTFAYVVPYAGYVDSGRGLDGLLTGNLVGNSIAGTPMFFGAIALVLGVLTVGGEYGWATWKTILTQGPSRSAVYGGKLVALLVAGLVMIVSMFTVGALASVAITITEGEAVEWPSTADLAVGVGAGWLIVSMWMALGVLLAVALRGVALPIGLGLVWLLAVQNLLAAIAAPLLDWVASVQEYLPGPNAGSLVAELGTSPRTPGVAELVSTTHSLVVLGGYLLVFVVAAGWLLRRRDVT